MAIQAGVIGAAQVQSPSSTLSGSKGSKPVANSPSGWAWFWFALSLLFLMFTHIAHRGRG